MTRLIDLGINSAIEAIKHTDTVMIRYGVWNNYKETATENAISSIKHSGYGADVSVDDTGMFYVSIPCDSDMW